MFRIYFALLPTVYWDQDGFWFSVESDFVANCCKRAKADQPALMLNADQMPLVRTRAILCSHETVGSKEKYTCM